MRGGESMTTDDKDKVNKGATATMVMDSVMVMRQRCQQWMLLQRWQWKVQRRHDSNNGHGCRNGKGDGWRNGNTMATEGAMVT